MQSHTFNNTSIQSFSFYLCILWREKRIAIEKIMSAFECAVYSWIVNDMSMWWSKNMLCGKRWERRVSFHPIFGSSFYFRKRLKFSEKWWTFDKWHAIKCTLGLNGTHVVRMCVSFLFSVIANNINHHLNYLCSLCCHSQFLCCSIWLAFIKFNIDIDA